MCNGSTRYEKVMDKTIGKVSDSESGGPKPHFYRVVSVGKTHLKLHIELFNPGSRGLVNNRNKQTNFQRSLEPVGRKMSHLTIILLPGPYQLYDRSSVP